MVRRVLLDDVINDSKRRSRRGLTKQRVLEGIHLALRMLPLLVVRRPALAPLQQALEALLQPSNGGERERRLARIRRLRGRLTKATTEREETWLRAQLEILQDLIRRGE